MSSHVWWSCHRCRRFRPQAPPTWMVTWLSVLFHVPSSLEVWQPVPPEPQPVPWTLDTSPSPWSSVKASATKAFPSTQRRNFRGRCKSSLMMAKSTELLLTSLGPTVLLWRWSKLPFDSVTFYGKRNVFLVSPFTQTETQYHFTPHHSHPIALSDRLGQTRGFSCRGTGHNATLVSNHRPPGDPGGPSDPGDPGEAQSQLRQSWWGQSQLGQARPSQPVPPRPAPRKRAQKGGGPKGAEPEGVGGPNPEKVWSWKVGAPKGGAQNVAPFSLSRPMFALFFSLCLLVEFWWCFWRPGPSNVHVEPLNPWTPERLGVWVRGSGGRRSGVVLFSFRFRFLFSFSPFPPFTFPFLLFFFLFPFFLLFFLICFFFFFFFLIRVIPVLQAIRVRPPDLLLGYQGHGGSLSHWQDLVGHHHHVFSLGLFGSCTSTTDISAGQRNTFGS